VTEAKQSWSSWIGWGKDQAAKTAEDLKRRANETEADFSQRWEEARAKAKAKGEEVVQRVGETEEQYRIRIARAIARKD
jgi:oligoendopeptidase F